MAEPYPDEAYLTPAGGIITNGFRDEERYRDRLEKRVRHIKGLAIPGRLLRAGRNVLAIDLRSAPHREWILVKDAAGRLRYHGFEHYQERLAHWVTVGMPAVSLRASGKGVRPALRRPAGFQVHSRNPLLPVHHADHEPVGTKLVPVRISAARNGSFSGQLLVGRDRPISGLKVSVGELKREGGPETLPASTLRMRYARRTWTLPFGDRRRPDTRLKPGSPCLFDALFEHPPATVTSPSRGSGALQPVWLTADVPAEAAPGVYRGKVVVEVDGVNAVEAPVHLRVSEWVAPPPSRWRTFADLLQSPESVALRYRVKMWSDEHFKLMERSFALLGGAGNKTVYLPLIAKTSFGNSGTLLRWVRQADGSLEPDFSAVDRYLALAKKHLERPLAVCLYVWDRHLGGRSDGKAASTAGDRPEITVFDRERGKDGLAKAPSFDDRVAAKAFWKPAIEGLTERIDRLGWKDALMLGVSGIHVPPKSAVAFWRDVLPGTPWAMSAYDSRTDLYGLARVGYAALVSPHRSNRPGRSREGIVALNQYDARTLTARVQRIHAGFLLGERCVARGLRGVGRLNGDFFRVKGGVGGARLIAGRYELNKNHKLTLKLDSLVHPGPAGPVSTERLEMLREGLLECEARIAVEAGLDDGTARERLGKACAGKLKAMLAERDKWIRRAGSETGAMMFVASGWRARRSALFDAAAEVGRAAKGH
jgi:hypothetical protein